MDSPPASPETRATPGVGHTPLRPEIQGLRAVAVLLVVLYHLWPGRLGGGYIGVDVFFVISGFLITGNLLRDVQRNGRVRLADFWARRARRLLPAAYLVLLVTAVGVFLWVPRLLWQQFFKEIAASGLYVENWSLARDAVDYLAASNAPSPTQHYWTLSAEEQFYLFWPLLIVLGIIVSRLARVQRERTIFVVLALTVVGSLAFSLWQTVSNPSVAYFSTFTRAWEFGAGALLACLHRSAGLRSPRVAASLSAAGLGVIAVGAFVFDESTPMPGTAAVLVVAGAVAVIAAGAPAVAWSPSRLLTTRPATFLGDISYSMYLWHWPLLILFPYVFAQHAGFSARVGILVATIVLSWLTKKLVEDPVRTTRNPRLRRPLISLGLAGAAAVGLVAVSGSAWWQVEQEARDSAALARTLLDDAPPCFGSAAMDPREKGCPNEDLEDKIIPSPTAVSKDYAYYPGCEERLLQRPLRPCTFGDASDRSVPHIAVIGDSHARALMPAIVELVDQGVLTADLYTSGGCIWGVGRPTIGRQGLRDACISLKADMQRNLRRDARTYDFMITTAWTNKPVSPIPDAERAVAAAWRPLARRGVPIVAVRDNPSSGTYLSTSTNSCLAEVEVDEANATCSLDRRRDLERYADPFPAAVKRTPGARYLDMTRFYCRGETCPAVTGGVNVYRDNSHVTVTYMRTMAPYFHRALADLGLVRPGKRS